MCPFKILLNKRHLHIKDSVFSWTHRDRKWGVWINTNLAILRTWPFWDGEFTQSKNSKVGQVTDPTFGDFQPGHGGWITWKCLFTSPDNAWKLKTPPCINFRALTPRVMGATVQILRLRSTADVYKTSMPLSNKKSKDLGGIEWNHLRQKTMIFGNFTYEERRSILSFEWM